MLSKVRLRNFKLHADTPIEAAPITIFIGPNNSGKSSVFHALLALRQAATRNAPELCVPAAPTGSAYRYSPDQLIDIGSFSEVVRPGESEIVLALEGTTVSSGFAGWASDVNTAFEVHVRRNRLVAHSGRIRVSVGELAWEFVSGVAGPVRSFPMPPGVLRFTPVGNFNLLQVRDYGFSPNLPQEEQAQLTEFGQMLASSPSRLLASLHPVFPLRGFEEWGYPVPEQAEQNIERMVLADRALATVSILFYNQDLLERLSRWLEDLLQIRIKIKPVPPRRLMLLSTSTGDGGGDRPFTGEGTGANQLPFILIPIGLAPPQDTVLLSEPEAHLHPKAQSDLAKLLLRIWKKENRQLLIETHSEHVLHAFLHAVASGEIDRSQLAIYYFQNEQGLARVERVQVDEQGRVKGGLPGFFDQSLAEFAEHLDALAKPRP